MTQDQVKFATGATAQNAQKFLPYLNDTCAKYSMDAPVKVLCFLAHLGHESGGLYYTQELASGNVYENRADLGNTHPGDGVRYKGRGLIQITGRINYEKAGQDLGVDLINNPTLLGGKNATVCTPDQLKYAAHSAGWFWNRAKLNDVAALIDMALPIDEGNNLKQYKKITKTINGGYNGLQDRVTRFKNGQPYFNGST